MQIFVRTLNIIPQKRQVIRATSREAQAPKVLMNQWQAPNFYNGDYYKEGYPLRPPVQNYTRHI